MKTLSSLFFGLLSYFAMAQDYSNVTNIYIRDIANPGYVGTNNMNLMLAHNQQWIGIDGAPQTSYLSFNLPAYIKQNRQKYFHGLGGFLHRDVSGDIQKSSAYFSYSYHVPLTKKWFLSWGASLGFIDYKISNASIILSDYSDAAAYPDYAPFRNLTPDVNSGIWLQNDQFYFGLSATHIIKSSVKLYSRNQFSRGLNLIAGTKLDISKHTKYEPSLMLDYNKKGLFHINNIVTWQKSVSFGFIYSSNKQYDFLLGMYLKNIFIGYSYKISTSDIAKINNGSHEVVLSYNKKLVPAKQNKFNCSTKRKKRK